MSTRAHWPVVLLAVTPIALAGCSSSSTSGKGTTATTPAAPSTSSAGFPSSTPAPSVPVSTSGGSEAVTPAAARAALLTPSDLGSDFAKAQFRPSNDPFPCTPNDPPLEQQIPSTLEVGTAIVSRTQAAAMGEDLRLYPDVATAQQVVALATRGLQCQQGQLNLTGTPETATFSPIHDVSTQVHADQAIAVQATTARYAILLIGCRIGRVLVLFDFLRTQATPATSLPDPIAVVSAGLDKIKNS